MQKIFIKDLKNGNKINSVFALKMKYNKRKYKNGFSAEFYLSDSTGEIIATYWGNEDENQIDEIINKVKKNDVVAINGAVTDWNGKLKININPPEGYIRKAEESEYNISDFVATTGKNINEMFDELGSIANSVQNSYLNSLLISFISDEDFAVKIKSAPAAMKRHQAYIGGLLEHTLNVTKICNQICKIHPELDRDLLITGALMHDLGKIEEFEVSTNIDISKKGMLCGHIILGQNMLNKAIDKIEKFPEDLKLKLIHMILSHHGKLEYGSPKTPQFPEALALYYADELDSKVDYTLKKKQEANTDDSWIYIPKHEGTHIFLE